jgi:dynein heavy chain
MLLQLLFNEALIILRTTFVLNYLGYHPDVPSCPFDEKFDQFSFLSLLTRAEVIHAMTKVRAECNRVAAMCLFQIPITKSMRLEEFEQTQSQASSQV